MVVGKLMRNHKLVLIQYSFFLTITFVCTYICKMHKM